jgi:hypothetical protein
MNANPITRRLFVSALAGVVVAPAGWIRLDAIVAAHMPQSLLVKDAASLGISHRDPRIFQLREYDSCVASHLRSILRRHGIHPAGTWGTAFLIPFDSLSAREKAWRSLAADPEWATVRIQSTVGQLAIYRVAKRMLSKEINPADNPFRPSCRESVTEQQPYGVRQQPGVASVHF